MKMNIKVFSIIILLLSIVNVFITNVHACAHGHHNAGKKNMIHRNIHLNSMNKNINNDNDRLLLVSHNITTNINKYNDGGKIIQGNKHYLSRKDSRGMMICPVCGMSVHENNTYVEFVNGQKIYVCDTGCANDLMNNFSMYSNASAGAKYVYLYAYICVYT